MPPFRRLPLLPALSSTAAACITAACITPAPAAPAADIVPLAERDCGEGGRGLGGGGEGGGELGGGGGGEGEVVASFTPAPGSACAPRHLTGLSRRQPIRPRSRRVGSTRRGTDRAPRDRTCALSISKFTPRGRKGASLHQAITNLPLLPCNVCKISQVFLKCTENIT